MDRQAGLNLVDEFVKDRGLRRHMLAVEAAMRLYAAKLGGEPETWGLAGLVHDFDWEVHPDLAKHPRDGGPILSERGVPAEVVQAVLAHNTEHTGVERQSPMDFALLACDEITGLIVATALVRPTKDIREVKVKSVKDKWKQKAFAAGVDRALAEQAAAEFSAACFGGTLDLWTHVGNVLEAMQGIAAELNLAGVPPAA
jgi:predicted hydrolase (HD superfamily)